MGGKSKQSQRTKNNARPSSSSRSAEILNSSVTQDTSALFPTLANVSFDHGLNPEYQMCIKKLNKKDPITRAKAVQELCELVNTGNTEDVLAALPSWAHFYKALTADTDRKVREVTQICHHAIMRACGRQAAPQLKMLIPSWLQAQYDEHGPAQSNAQLSLKSTFPDSKLPEVISFCRVEVMTHFQENLIGKTSAIISKKTEDQEEREHQMSRIITSTLQGIEYFTPNLPAAHHDWLWGQLKPLLEASAYWKYATHNAHQVRAAWYGAMGRIIERYKGLFGDKYGLKCMRMLLKAARDSNALVSAQVWTCLLQFMHNIEEWQQYLDKKELLVKRILDILEMGGWGDAKHLSTMLLPLLAHLPQDILTKEFYVTFFDAIYKGLDNRNVMISKSEQRAWVTSLAECLRYLSTQQNDFVAEVAASVHKTWLEKILSLTHDNQTRNNLVKCSATNMASLVKYWLKMTNEKDSEKYEQLLRNHWQNISATVSSQIDECGTDLAEIEKLIEGHILLLQILKSSFIQEPKKFLSIKFRGDLDIAHEESPAVTERFDAALIEIFKKQLYNVVNKICSHYFQAVDKTKATNTILTPLITLLTAFDSHDLLIALTKQFNFEEPIDLFTKVLLPWLNNNETKCKAIVNIIFLMSKYLPEQEQDIVFEAFKQLDPNSLEWCLSVCVSYPYLSQVACRRWARSDAACDAAAAVAQRAATHSDIVATALLFLCLADGPDGAPMISGKGISLVMHKVLSPVTNYTSGTLESSGTLAARLVTMLASSDSYIEDLDGFLDLTVALFKINLIVPRGDSELTVETWCEIRSSWQDGLAMLKLNYREQFLEQATKLLHEELLKGIDDVLDIPKHQHIMSLCPYIFAQNVPILCDQPDDLAEIVAFTRRLFNIIDDKDVTIETCGLRHLCLTSKMNCLYDDGNPAVQKLIQEADEPNIQEMTSKQLTRYINMRLFHAMYLRAMFVFKIGLEDDHLHLMITKTWGNTLLTNNYIREEYCKVLYFLCVLEALYDGYTFWPDFNIIEGTKQSLSPWLQETIDETSKSVRELVVDTLLEKSSEEGYYWAYAHRLYRYTAITNSQNPLDFGPDDLKTAVSGNGFFHMLQAASNLSDNQDYMFKTAYLIMLRSWNIANTQESKLEFIQNNDNDEFDLDIIIQAYYKDKSTMLYDTDITAASWAQVCSNVAVVRFLELMVRKMGWTAPSHYWDFTTITLCSVLASVRKSHANWGSTKVTMLARAVLRLFCEIFHFVSDISVKSTVIQPQQHVVDLIKEWKDIFSPEATEHIYNCAVDVLTSTDQTTSLTVAKYQYVLYLIVATDKVEWRHLAPLKAQQLSLERLARSACTTFARPAHPGAKYLAFNVVCSIAKDMVFDDAMKLELWSDDLGDASPEEERNTPAFCLEYFHDTFRDLQEIVEAAINHVATGEEICELVPFTDSHSMTLGWLLMIEAMFIICRMARGDLVHFYVQLYRKNMYSVPQLTTCFRLLPSEVFAYGHDNTGNTPVPTQYNKAFLEITEFNMREACSSASVPALACRGLLTAVCGAGCAAARGWWGAALPPIARALERIVALHISPQAVKDQFSHLQERTSEIPDTEIRIAWSAREVICDYTVEESTLQLRVVLSHAHPLLPPRLTAPNVSGPGSNTQWIALYLAYQNGTLLNALKMWTAAVNARVERSPQCYICYCRLHPATGRLPRVPCHQCKNKFHDMCLRKWFSTSNKSNCPLCRATF